VATTDTVATSLSNVTGADALATADVRVARAGGVRIPATIGAKTGDSTSRSPTSPT